MPLVPYRFLLRVSHPCPFVADLPREEGDDLLDLPETCRIESFTAMDDKVPFADLRLAWNTGGLAVQVIVKGKQEPLKGDVARPRQADGISLWLDTRDSRTSHRASRYCHLFHLLATGGGSGKDEAAFVQGKINRALEDAPTVPTGSIALRRANLRNGYLLEAFLPAEALNGFDPEQSTKLGFYYAVRDQELGEQTLAVDAEFPWAEDPTLWGVLQLEK